MQAARPSSTAPANHGSRTLTVNETHADPSTGEPSTSTSSSNDAGVLRLRGRALNSARVQWTDETVDNEFLGRKKSKICCIYHKSKEFDESSGDESDSSCGSNDSRIARPSRHSHHHHHDGDCSHDAASGAGGGGGTAERGGTVTEVETVRAPTPPEPNAYEKGGKGGKGKGRA
ncbi:type 1 phosphatases regulator Ypi-1 [Pseudohyphozyma bogoriensis]|nr:type 1 phosphatases regulator Ypi-1 [Pseudohyphozyma bogoriensis]